MTEETDTRAPSHTSIEIRDYDGHMPTGCAGRVKPGDKVFAGGSMREGTVFELDPDRLDSICVRFGDESRLDETFDWFQPTTTSVRLPCSKAPEEIAALKREWVAAPQWDIEDTSGFEMYRAELIAFREERARAREVEVAEEREAAIVKLMWPAAEYLNRVHTDVAASKGARPFTQVDLIHAVAEMLLPISARLESLAEATGASLEAMQDELDAVRESVGKA